MLLDLVMPKFDATRIEHRVIDALPAHVYEVATHVDFLGVMRRSRAVRSLFAVRGAAERVAAGLRRTEVVSQPEPPAMRLSEMRDHGDWVRLGEDPPSEFVFGVIGRFWGGATSFEQIDSSAFAVFESPGYARIAANLSLRSYGDQRTLISYEARTQTTDEAARRAFLRYWSFASPGAGIVMRSLLALIAHEAIRARVNGVAVR